MQTPKYMHTSFLKEDVLNDLSRLFEEGQDHDLEFKCEDKIIKAHKSVLCCRSATFTSMFKSDINFGFTNQVTIQDVESSIFRQFLRCLYAGDWPELTVDVAKRLYEVAEKYAVHALKTHCISFLMENLSPDNACNTLIIADRYGDRNCKKTVMEYVIKQKIQFMEEKWPDLCKISPTLATEVLSLFCQNLQQDTKKKNRIK